MIIYKTTNLINGNFYIGQDSKNNPNYLGSGTLLNKAIKKYGKENFVKEIIECCDSKQQLNEREIFWILELKPIYNIAIGGSGGDTYKNNPNYDLIIEKLKKRPGRGWTEEEKDRQRGDNNPAKRADIRNKIRLMKLGKPRLDLIGDNNPSRRDDVRHKISTKLKGKPKPKITCPHCNIIEQPSNMYRWHNENCKLKNKK